MLNRFKKILYPATLILFLAFTFQGNPPGGWYQQTITGIGTSTIKDMTFIDSLTGYAVTSFDSNNNSYILKTTNGGDNWFINHTVPNQRILQKVKFININTGFVNLGYNELYKTTDAGNNWNIITLPMDLYSFDMSVLNVDTLWLAQSTPLVGGIFKTTNGGLNWIKQFGGSSGNPDKVYFFDANLGFHNGGNNLYRTSNGGTNWSIIPSVGGYTDIKFANNLTGWLTRNQASRIKKTTDGGLNWFDQILPPENAFFIFSRINDLYVLNKDTLWGSGPHAMINATTGRGLLFISTNGGNNWGYQLPDTSISIGRYNYISFINNKIGWAYDLTDNKGIHTTTGGDTTIIVNVSQNYSEVPSDFKLLQNYPNPFNPTTKIPFVVKQKSKVNLSVYDVTGKLITDLINSNYEIGVYEISFNASHLTSGVYFYTLKANNFVETKKMLLVK